MNSGLWLSILFVALALILPVSALLQRRIALSSVAAMVLVWGAIFIVVTLAIGFLIR